METGQHAFKLLHCPECLYTDDLNSVFFSPLPDRSSQNRPKRYGVIPYKALQSRLEIVHRWTLAAEQLHMAEVSPQKKHVNIFPLTFEKAYTSSTYFLL